MKSCHAMEEFHGTGQIAAKAIFVDGVWRRIGKRRTRLFYFLKGPMQLREARLRESSAHPPDIDKLTIPFVLVDTQQQRAESAPRSGWIGEPADHKLLTTVALRFDPIAVTPRKIPAVRSLRDQPFQAPPAGRFEDGAPFSSNMVAVS